MLKTALCFLAVSFVNGFADPVSREVPALYETNIKSLLTEAEPLLKQPAGRESADKGGEVVLMEHIVMIDESFRRVEASHAIYRATAESGVEAISRDVDRFHKKRSRIHLALARTVQPDGRSLPVRGEAAFIQTPQRSADSDLYDDQGELVIIYPDVKKGSAAESIVVHEEVESRIPGQFTMLRNFSAGWPIVRDRFILEVPAIMAGRVRLTTLGSGVPEPVRSQSADGTRVRWTWERQDIPGTRREENRVSADQTGPIVYISTLQSWEEFMAWYLPQAEAKMILSDALKSKIDEWTRDASSPTETTAILLKKVSQDVRYVGLEFGTGDLIPRDANATWENQYGDCKDKACLLAAMLRHKGIKASPALINTDFPGRIERRSPDFRHFDHCITAVALADGSWQFCDPTIPGLPPGGIGPADGDRDVLLVQPGASVEWAHTPPHEFGLLRHKLDLQMDAAGALSGWATIEADGFNATRYAAREEKATTESLRDSLQSSLGRLSEGLTAVDVKKHPREEGKPYQIESYILIPGSGVASLPFLADSGYIPQTGNEDSRETAFSSWREVYEAEVRFALPAGVVPGTLPDPLVSNSAWADARASWEWKDAVLTSRFRFHSKSAAIPPPDFPAFAGQMRAINAWLGRPLALKNGTSADTPAVPVSDRIDALPHLPTVEGQLLFVDNKYPETGNATLRRRALEKSITYFPGNQEMLYRAGCQLTWLELRDGTPAAALQRLDNFQPSCRPHVDGETASLGDYFRAMALEDLGRTDEALTLFRQLAADSTLSPFRRTWSIHRIGGLLRDKAPEEALSAYRTGLALQAAEAEAILYPPWAALLLQSGRTDEIKSVLGKLAADRSEAAPAILTFLAEKAASLPAGQAPGLLKILTELGPAGSFGQDFAKALDGASGQAVLGTIGDTIRTRLGAFLEKHPDSSRDAKLPEGVKTAEDMSAALTRLLKDGVKDVETAVHLGIEAILQSPPGADLSVPLNHLLDITQQRDTASADPAATGPIFEEAIALTQLLPKSTDTYYEGRYAMIRLLSRQGKAEPMKHAAEAMLAEADPARSWTAIAPLLFLRDEAAKAGDYKETGRRVTELGHYADQGSSIAHDGYFYQAVISIHEGKYEAALACLADLAKVPEARIQAMSLHEQATSLLRFIHLDRDAAVKWWKDSAVWWPAFQAVVRQIDPGTAGSELPLIPSLEEALRTAGVATAKKDFPALALAMLKLGGASRLDPAYLEAYGGILSQGLTDGMQSFAKEMESSLVAADPFVPDLPAYRNLAALIEESYFRQKNWPKTTAAARRFFGMKAEPDAVSGFAARFWSVAAEQSQRDYAEVAATFKTILDAQADAAERPRNLYLRAHMLILDGKQAEARAMLKAEIAGGKLDPAHPITAQLPKLLETPSKNTGMSDPEIAGARAAAERWLETARPAWFDWMSPATLTDPGMKDLEDWLDKTTAAGGIPALKAAVLILRDPDQPAAIRQKAVTAFLSLASQTASDPARRAAEWEAVFTSPGLDEEDRAYWLAVRVLQCGPQNWPFTYQKWADHPLLETTTPRMQARLARNRRLEAGDWKDPAKLKSQALAILGETIDSDALFDFAGVMNLLLRHDPEGASQVLAEFHKTTIPSAAAELAASIKLEGNKQLEATAEYAPIHHALKQVAGKFLGPDFPRPPDADLMANEQSARVTNMDLSRRVPLLLWEISTDSFDHRDLEVWEKLVSCLDRHGKYREAASALSQAALTSAATDETAAAAIRFAMQCLDIDDPAQFQQMQDLFGPLRLKSDWTGTADQLTFFDAASTLRTGTATDASAALDAIHDRQLKYRLTRMQIGTLIANGEAGRLRKFIKNQPSLTLLSPVCLRDARAAWRLLGMKQEATLAETRMKETIRKLLEEAWPERDISGIFAALHFLLDLEDSSLLPTALEADLRQWCAEPVQLNQALFLIAAVRGDWETCATRGLEEIKLQPANYSSYFYAGKACAKTGRKAEAINILGIYLKMTHDESVVPEARFLLKTLQP